MVVARAAEQRVVTAATKEQVISAPADQEVSPACHQRVASCAAVEARRIGMTARRGTESCPANERAHAARIDPVIAASTVHDEAVDVAAIELPFHFAVDADDELLVRTEPHQRTSEESPGNREEGNLIIPRGAGDGQHAVTERHGGEKTARLEPFNHQISILTYAAGGVIARGESCAAPLFSDRPIECSAMPSPTDFPTRGKVIAVKDGFVVFAPRDTTYEMHLQTPKAYTGPVNAPIDAFIRLSPRQGLYSAHRRELHCTHLRAAQDRAGARALSR